MISYFYLFTQTPLKKLMEVNKPNKLKISPHKLKISQFKRDPSIYHVLVVTTPNPNNKEYELNIILL